MKYDLEKIFLVTVFGVLLWAGAANLWDYRLDHEFPYGLMASDAFQHQTRAEGIKVEGNYRLEPFYISGGFKDAIGFYNPLMYHLGIVFSYVSGLETWDSTYLLIFILGCLSALGMYLIIRGFNKNVAILSLPLMILIFASKDGGPGPYAGFTWGVWPAYIGHFFLIAVFWVMANMEIKRSYVLLSIFLSGVALGHTSELIFAVLFIAIYLAADILMKRFDIKKLKNVIYAGAIFFVVSIYYLIIFKFTWGAVDEGIFSFSIEKTTLDPTFYLIDFKLTLIFIILGVIFSLLFIKKMPVALVSGIFMLLIGTGNYYGFSRHAFRTKALWPIYLSVFFGLAIYQIGKFLIKKWKMRHSLITSLVLLILFMGLFSMPFIPQYKKFTSQGLMNRYNWEAFRWVKDNADIDASVLFLYGDAYGQNAILRNAERTSYLINSNNYADALNNKLVKREYLIRLTGDHSGVRYAYRKSLFSYGYHLVEDLNNTVTKDRDICSFDYYVFDTSGRIQALAQYNLLIKDILVKNDWIEEVFSNELTTIIKNNKPGQECIPDGGIRLE